MGLTKRDSGACAQESRGKKSRARACPYGQAFRPFLKLFQDAEQVVSGEKRLKTGALSSASES